VTRTVVEQYAVTLLLCYALAAELGRLKQLVDQPLEGGAA